MLDHVVIFYSKDSEYEGIHADELDKLANDFHKFLFDSLDDGSPVVDKPGPNVERIRLAIKYRSKQTSAKHCYHRSSGRIGCQCW